jgi:broad specificity phosphatase PhoE
MLVVLDLKTSYYLVRAGESTFETRGLINTNPVAKTSVDSGLSEEGKKQTIQAAKNLSALGACDDSCWIWPSITQRAYQTAEIIAYVNNINRRSHLSSLSYAHSLCHVNWGDC